MGSSESGESETICCDHCGYEYGRSIGDLCPNCETDNKEQFDEKYGEVE